MINNFNGPINHLSRKEVAKVFPDELSELKALRERVRQKAIELESPLLIGYKYRYKDSSQNL